MASKGAVVRDVLKTITDAGAFRQLQLFVPIAHAQHHAHAVARGASFHSAVVHAA
jgi:hypothetical protein